MSKTDRDSLDPMLQARLRAELSAVRPPSSEPRYASAAAPIRVWRLAPLMLAIAFTGILALTAFAATGSPNPAVWTNRVETVINPPAPSPSPESEPAQPQSQGAPATAPAHKPTAPPTERAEPSGSPAHESPEPSDDHESPNPSPSPGPSPPSSPSGDH
jgi:hypothetical protein